MGNFELKNEKLLLTVKIIALLLYNAVLLMLLPSNFNIDTVARISIVQLVLNLVVVNLRKRKTAIFISLFVFFSWLFHCGQIAKYAFNITGDVPLPFFNYGSESDFILAFKFYFMSQILLVIGSLIGTCYRKKRDTFFNVVNYEKLATILLLIGIGPRLYIDISRVIAAHQNGYAGVYNLEISTVVNTIAFFCDAGCFLKLSIKREKKSNSLFFLAVVLYKLFVMTSGARQQAFCFLIIWIVFYCWNIKRIKACQKIALVVIFYFLVVFVDFIGSVREEGFLFSKFIESASFANNTLIGDILGEFGSGFCSLVVAIHGFPDLHPFGYGKSYVAAILSAIPKLVNLFPSLKESVTYTTILPNTKYFGGSYLGELYYNFSWFGICFSSMIGYVVGKCQKNISRNNDSLCMAWSAIILYQFILFTRGYITDMAQSCIWLWLFIKLYFSVFNNKQNIHSFMLYRENKDD